MGEREQMHAKLIKIAHELREKDVSILQFCMPNFHKHIPCKPLPNGTLVITEGNDVPVLTNVALEALLSEDTFEDAAGNAHPGFKPAYIRVARACMLEGKLRVHMQHRLAKPAQAFLLELPEPELELVVEIIALNKDAREAIFDLMKNVRYVLKDKYTFP